MPMRNRSSFLNGKAGSASYLCRHISTMKEVLMSDETNSTVTAFSAPSVADAPLEVFWKSKRTTAYESVEAFMANAGGAGGDEDEAWDALIALIRDEWSSTDEEELTSSNLDAVLAQMRVFHAANPKFTDISDLTL